MGQATVLKKWHRQRQTHRQTDNCLTGWPWHTLHYMHMHWGGSGISWSIINADQWSCAPHSRQLTTPAPHSISTGRMLFLTPNQQCRSTEGTHGTYKILHICQGASLWPPCVADAYIIFLSCGFFFFFLFFLADWISTILSHMVWP